MPTASGDAASGAARGTGAGSDRFAPALPAASPAPSREAVLSDLVRTRESRRPADPPLPEPDALPADHPKAWPHELRSRRFPLVIRHRSGEEAVARKVLRTAERAWSIHRELGFRPPPLAPGKDAFDVYLWKGAEEAYVASYDEIPETARDDALTYMVVDPEGPHGGQNLRRTVIHEISHAFQAADDWNEFPAAYEGSATYVEWKAGGLGGELLEVLSDFQSRPHWGLDRDDGGETWHTYGFAFYLRFLERRYFGGDPGFLAELWQRSRNAPGGNEPDLADALEALLPGTSYAETAVEFARWRYYTGSRADAGHDPDAARIPEVPLQQLSLRSRHRRVAELDPPPQLLGSSYVELARAPGGPEELEVSLVPESDRVRYVVQVVPGGEGSPEGERLDLSDGTARIRIPEGSRRTLIVTAVPREGESYDPDTRSDAPHPARLLLQPR